MSLQNSRPTLDTPRLSPHASPQRSVLSLRQQAPEDGVKWSEEIRDPWDPLILTLDGGGIRGYSSLLILKALMREIAAEENRQEARLNPDSVKHFDENELLPCHYFDYLYGTSTGGLIATMLGRLRMSVPQCLEIYRQVGDDLFGKRRSVIPLTTKYRHRPLEYAVRRIVKDHCKEHGEECDGSDWHPWRVDEGKLKDCQSWSSDPEPVDRICQTICLTAVHNAQISEAYLLRTYPHRYTPGAVPNWITLYNEGCDPLRIWQVTRATSAAPFFFKQLEADIHNELRNFKDGGIRENNPAGAAWSEFVSLYGVQRRDGKETEPGLLLSVGTGRPNEENDGFASAWPGPFGSIGITKKAAEKFAVFKNVLIKYTEGERQHQAMVRLAKGEHHWYKRLNVSEGLGTMKLDNWEKGAWPTKESDSVPGGKTLSRMEELTTDYLTRPYDPRFETYAAPKVMVEQTAKKLVKMRRAREARQAEDQRRWDTFMGKYLTGQFCDEIDRAIRHGLGQAKDSEDAVC